jgi:glycosyltransferase involved in cell wall biosynthesis
MKVVINAVGAVKGGAARHLPAFLKAMRLIRPDWALVCYVNPGITTSLKLGVDIEVVEVRVRTHVGRVIWDGISLGRAAATSGADCVVHLTNGGPVWPAVPSIVYQRNSLYFDPLWVSRLACKSRCEAWIRRSVAFEQMRVSGLVVTPSTAMASFLRSWKPSGRWASAVVPHGFDTTCFPYHPHPPRSRRAPRLAVISHPAPHKGLDTAVRAVARLRRLGLDPVLTLTVDPADRDEAFQAYVVELANLARSLGADRHLEFVGSVMAVADLYAKADVVIAPSHTESFGFPVLEAMASGVAVVSSSIPASSELLGSAGLYFAAGDDHALTQQLLRLLATSEAEVADMIAAGRDRAVGYTWERNAQAMADLIERKVRY